MKTLKNLFLTLVTILTLSSCSDNNNDNLFIDDSSVGKERFTIATVSPNYAGKINEMNGILYNAYVMPNYLETTKVELTVMYKTGSGKIFLNSEEMLDGQKVNINNLFDKILDADGNWTGAYSTFFTIYFTSSLETNLEVDLIFENSLGNVIPIPLSLIIQ